MSIGFRSAACLLLALAGSTSTARAQQAGDLASLARARADSLRLPHTAADVHFMTAMIGHHAQAIVMADLAVTNGATGAVAVLAARIRSSQDDEIATMQQWLRDRGQPVPDAHAAAHDHAMEHGTALMPGMLSDTQLRELASARGVAFERRFLRFMIQHHAGATEMVRQLFASPGAAEDERVFKFASDVNVDQTTEIARMERMLAALPPDRAAP